MEERLGEIAGTLARTKERKNTILYKAVQRKREEEKLARLGVKRLPANPRETDDPKVMAFVISQLKSEIGECIEKLRRPAFLSLEKDGESGVRAKNDEVNRLLAKKNAWEMKLALTTNTTPPVLQRRKFFFGCAKELPEASSQKRQREEDDYSADAELDSTSSPPARRATQDESASEAFQRAQSATHDYHRGISELISDDTNALLLPQEKEMEKKWKESVKPPNGHGAAERTSTPTLYVNSYMQDGQLKLPDEKYFEQAQLEKKKKALMERLQSIKGTTPT